MKQLKAVLQSYIRKTSFFLVFFIVKYFSIAFHLFSSLEAFLIMLYSVYLHGRYGQTLGKKVMNIRVLDLNESKTIGFKYAFYREAILFIFHSIGMLFIISISINNTAYYTEQLSILNNLLISIILDLLTILPL